MREARVRVAGGVAAEIGPRFCSELAAPGAPVARGVFGVNMEVELVNDGSVTIVLDV